jgi:hypothetical protein
LAQYRQWVLSAPKPLRLRLARDLEWASWVGNLAVRAIGAWQRRIARARGAREPRIGAFTFVQRFGGAGQPQRALPHRHSDGVFVDDDHGGSRSCCIR